MGAATFVEILRGRAETDGARCAFTFLADGEAREESLTYADVMGRAGRIAAVLADHRLRGETTLVLCPPGPDFLAAFFGCLFSGTIAVPTYPPESARSDRAAARRLLAVARDCGARVALIVRSQRALFDALASEIPELQGLRFLAVEDAVDASPLSEPAPKPNDVAFLQYTSGSTSSPKGVVVTHDNLIHNSALIQRAFRQSAESRSVIWLPPYHDMGLIGGVLQPIFSGYPALLLPPALVLQRPLRWLEAIGRFRATVSGGPNFAYDLVVRRTTPDQREALDLRCWKTAFNGSEPVHRNTLDSFAAAFASCGFEASSFYPCYGLAEATLLVAAGAGVTTAYCRGTALEANRLEPCTPEDAEARALVACGEVAGDQDLRIVNPETRRLASSGEVGEIWVAGRSVARQYWNADATEDAFGGRLEGGAGPYLRTGDLGFVQDGRLYVTGRLKDLIIVRGRNHYPQDIEETVEQSHPALRAGDGAAFSVEVGGEDRLVVVQEIRHAIADAEPVFEDVRRAVAEHHGLETHAVLLLRPGRIPKTTSGKVQRRVCRARYLDASLDVVASSVRGIEWAEERKVSPLPRTDPVEALRAEVARVLRVDVATVPVAAPLGTLGLDSLAALELQHRLESTWRVSIPMVRFLHDATIADLAGEVRRSGSAGAPPPTLPRRDPAVPAPASYAQEQLWFLWMLDPGSPAYNVAAAVRLTGGLDVPRLGRCLNEVVRRHEVLRTTFDAPAGQARQVVRPPFEVPLDVVDLRAEPEAARAAAAEQRLRQEARRPFDLKRGPLVRATILRAGEHEHLLLVTLHHIACDGWSSAVFIKELTALYGAFAKGETPALPELPIQYGDFASWQRAWLESSRLEDALAFWREHLAGPLPILDLPTDRARAGLETYRGAAVRARIGPEVTRSLKALAAREHATLYMVLLAAFKAQLHRYTGQEDLVVGTRSNGRPRAELEPLIGFFVNGLPLRTTVDASLSFRELLRRVRDVCRAAYAHQDVPFDLLVENVKPPRALGRHPLFQVMCVLQNFPQASLDLPGVAVEAVPVDVGTAKLDLDLAMTEEADGGLALCLEINTDLFDPETGRRMLQHFKRMAEAAAAKPESAIGEMVLVECAERTRLIEEWGRGPQAELENAGLVELFHRQVDRVPERTAVISGDERLSFSALDARTSHLAHRLQALGVGPDVPVAVFAERSIDTLVALLAVLKAGGAYLPLDVSHPTARIAHMLGEARPAVVLAQRAVLDRLPRLETRAILLDSDSAGDGVVPSGRPTSQATSRHLSHIMYTSGSTGRPKGVLVEQIQLLNRMAWMWRRYPFTDDDVCCQRSTPTFSVSLWELLGGALQGVPTVILPDAVTQDPRTFIEVLARERVTRVLLVPSLLRILLEADPEIGERLPRLQLWTVCGEPMTKDLYARFFSAFPKAVLLNDYGATEMHGVLLHEATREQPLERAWVPSGRPIGNTRVFVLDGGLEPVPAGVTGDLYVATPGLARGYLNAPALTAARFRPNPFGGAPGARLYDTGDRAAFLADGRLEYRGRRDAQVKVRGVRVEPAEVEAALMRHANVQEAAVAARGLESGEARLLAYVVAREEPAPNASELRAFLASLLPEPMIPASFVAVAALPRTPSGKIERRALPALSGQRPSLDSAFVPPTSETERIVAEIWKDLLQLDTIGVDDNFFDLGGHSLLLVEMLNRLRAHFDEELALVELFEQPTVSALALRLCGQAAAAPADPATAVRGQTRKQALQEQALRRQRR